MWVLLFFDTTHNRRCAILARIWVCFGKRGRGGIRDLLGAGVYRRVIGGVE